MSSEQKTLALAAGLFALLAGAGAPLAAGLTLKCGRADVQNPKWKVPETFVYAGGDSGPLKISGPFGDFSINVRRTTMPAGKMTTGEALAGTATVRVKLPPLADLEACIAKSLTASGAKPDDKDAYLNGRDACLQTLPPPGEGVDATASLRIGFFKDGSSGEDAFVDLRFKYEGASKAPGGAMVVEPSPEQCVMEK